MKWLNPLNYTKYYIIFVLAWVCILYTRIRDKFVRLRAKEFFAWVNLVNVVQMKQSIARLSKLMICFTYRFLSGSYSYAACTRKITELNNLNRSPNEITLTLWQID